MREEGWGCGHGVLALQRSRPSRWPGDLELLLGPPAYSSLESLLQSSSNPLSRDSETMPNPLLLDFFAHTSLLLMPWTRPSKGEAHYLYNAPGTARGKPGGFPSFRFASTLGML